ncbi:ATP-binding protein [Streptomyces noursei]|uniref:ATP-binding protein n=1 Tax=Streptomyces noursei TaxID=1971 RepID=UPI00081C7F3C|nr:anti-sigma regulatory factor (Ser/Thr protein kinase) [Streptomyces noursei ATCC 11455]
MARTVELPATSAEARDRVLALLRACHRQVDEVVVADALLITSELVTNALRHAGGVTGFAARIAGDRLEVIVEDASPVRPFVPSDIRDGRIGGYGWSLVRRLATSVAITPAAAGKGIHIALRLT